MKKCKVCNVTYPDSYIYCPKCGAKLKDDLFGDLFTDKDADFFNYTGLNNQKAKE